MKIKEGGVMGIQKELTDCNNWILEQDDDFVTGYGQGNYALGLARLAWQAAKSQAVPEGYVLMPIKPTKKMVMAVVKEHEGDAFLPYSLYDAYVKQAMIEAQEQAND